MQSNGVYTTNLIKIIIAPPSTPIQPKTLFFAQKASCVVRTTSYLNIIFRQNIQGGMIEEHLGDKTTLSLCRRDAQNQNKVIFFFIFVKKIAMRMGPKFTKMKITFVLGVASTQTQRVLSPGAPLSFPLIFCLKPMFRQLVVRTNSADLERKNCGYFEIDVQMRPLASQHKFILKKYIYLMIHTQIFILYILVILFLNYMYKNFSQNMLTVASLVCRRTALS